LSYNSKLKVDISPSENKKPNVIIVITDRGYGNIGAYRSVIVKNPILNAFYKEFIYLTDFHVGTTCAHSRSRLMTGRYANKVGICHNDRRCFYIA